MRGRPSRDGVAEPSDPGWSSVVPVATLRRVRGPGVPPTEARAGARLGRIVGDRLRKRGLYDTAAYWDGKVDAYEGLARSAWPSNAYNAHLHARQMRLLDDALGDVRGLSIADVGCGTGRASVHLARRGARVVGLDFAEKALAIGRADAARERLAIDFRRWDVLAAPEGDLLGRADVVLTFGCLAVACADEAAFERALGHVLSLRRPGGRVLFLEPAHRSRLLGRILRIGVDAWIARCEARGLRLRARGGVAFVPARMALAFRDLPDGLVTPAFALGERILDASPRLERLADYKWMLFDG